MFNRLYIIDPENKNRSIDMEKFDIELQREAFLFVKSLTFEKTYCFNGEEEVCFSVMNDIEVEKYKKLCEKTNSHFEMVDVSMDAINGTLSKRFEDKPYITEECINFFIRNYVDKDMIYDKINEYGVESLTELDKEILARD